MQKHPDYEMYYAVYPDGEISQDFYSHTRALEHTKVLSQTASTMPLRGPTELTGAFKSESGTYPPLECKATVRASYWDYLKITDLLRKWTKGRNHGI